MKEIVLGDNEIENLINGIPIHKTLPSGEVISIRQSYVKDVAKPIINHDKKVFSNAEIENLRKVPSIIESSFKLGL